MQVEEEEEKEGEKEEEKKEEEKKEVEAVADQHLNDYGYLLPYPKPRQDL